MVKGRNDHIWKCHVTMTKKGRNLLIRKYHVTLGSTKAVTYISQIIVQLLFSKISSLLSTTSILSRSPMTYNTTETLDKLALTDYVAFGKTQDRFGHFSWSKNDSNYLDIKLKVIKREEKCRISTETKLFNGRSWFQPVHLKKKPTSCCSRQLSQRTKFVAISSIYTVQRHGGATEACSQGDWRCRLTKERFYMTLLRYKVDNPQTSYAQVRLFGRKKEEEKFNILCMSTKNLKNLYVFLTSWIQCMIK